MNQNISKIRLELLNSERRELLAKLSAKFPDFVLGGGTALSLQISHRQSFDLDFFSPEEISKKLLEKIKRIIPITRVVRDSADELTFYVSDIKITFLSYLFPKIFQRVKSENSLKYFPVEAIAWQKAYAIGRRGVWRDYFDLYSIFKIGESSIKEIISSAGEVYGDVFNPKIFLEQLVYFDDLDDLTIIPIENQTAVSPAEIKEFLKTKVKEYLEHE